jgi:phosphatidylserine decarboxylase
MTIHKEGYKTISIIALVCLVLGDITLNYVAPLSNVIAWGIYVILFGFWLFIVSFFRIPSRTFTYNEDAVVSPADGKVVVIEEVFDTEFFQEKRLQISVFMSPANVHVNRYPFSGKVVYSQYHKGKYLVAWDPKSSTENERHSIVLSNPKADVLVKQIAGALAKRIVNYSVVGEDVKQNEELGFIKFGSRVDLLLPLGTPVNVKIGDKVKNGVSVLAKLS